MNHPLNPMTDPSGYPMNHPINLTDNPIGLKSAYLTDGSSDIRIDQIRITPLLCKLTSFGPGKMLIISKFSRLNRISLGRLQIAAYNTPVLWFVPSNGWNQSKFNIRPRCESTTSALKKFGNVSSLVPLNVFQTRPSYISVNMSSKPDRLAQCLKEFSKPFLRNIVASCSRDRKSTRLNSSHDQISYAVFCLKKKIQKKTTELNTLAS